MKATEFTEMVFNNKAPNDTSGQEIEDIINDYIIDKCGQQTFDDWSILLATTVHKEEHYKEFKRLLAITPSEVMFYYCRHFYIEDEGYRKIIESDDALLYYMANARGVKARGVNGMFDPKYFKLGKYDVKLYWPENPLSRVLAVLFGTLFVVDVVSGNMLGALLMFVFFALHVTDIR